MTEINYDQLFANNTNGHLTNDPITEAVVEECSSKDFIKQLEATCTCLFFLGKDHPTLTDEQRAYLAYAHALLATFRNNEIDRLKSSVS